QQPVVAPGQRALVCAGVRRWLDVLFVAAIGFGHAEPDPADAAQRCCGVHHLRERNLLQWPGDRQDLLGQHDRERVVLQIGRQPARADDDRRPERDDEQRPRAPARHVLTTGSSTTNRAPALPSGRSSTHTRPPCSRTCSATRASPRPTPSPLPRRPAPPPRAKRSKITWRSSGGTPGPWSSTASCTPSSTCSSCTPVAPSPYLRAL